MSNSIYTVAAYANGEFVSRIDPHTPNPELARGAALEFLRTWRPDAEHRAVFELDGRPYSNLRSGQYDDVVELQLASMLEVLGRAERERSTRSLATELGWTRESALSVLSVLEYRGQVAKVEDGRSGNYLWTLTIDEAGR